MINSDSFSLFFFAVQGKENAFINKNYIYKVSDALISGSRYPPGARSLPPSHNQKIESDSPSILFYFSKSLNSEIVLNNENYMK